MTRVIFSTGSLWLMDTAHAFDLAAAAGFDGIEVMCDERVTSRDPDYLQQLSKRYQLPIPVVHTPFSRRVPGWGRDKSELDRIQRTLHLAEAIGAESIVVHLPLRMGWTTVRVGAWRTRLPWRSQFGDVRKWIASGELARQQQETDVQIAIENMPTKRMLGRDINPAHWNTIQDWSTVHTHLTLDTTHWGTFGIDPTEALRAAGERVKHVHLSNYAHGQEHRLPQKGDLDLGIFLQTLAGMDFRGTVSLEVTPDALAFTEPDVTRRKLRESLDFCREHLSQRHRQRYVGHQPRAGKKN